MLGFWAYPSKKKVNTVERALYQFCFEMGFVSTIMATVDGSSRGSSSDGSYQCWDLILGTSYMYVITKDFPD